MTQRIPHLAQIAAQYDAIVFDQWGVLHNGTEPYKYAVQCIENMVGKRLAVLSNSGKRSTPNAARIAAMGFDAAVFDIVMTSGEALWRDIAAGKLAQRRFYPIERSAGDATAFAADLNVEMTSLDSADAILLMGLPDDSTLDQWEVTLRTAFRRELPLYCSNPDRKSPRGHGTVISPGVLAFAYKDMGGDVTFYGKPHLPIFQALQTALGPGRYLMIGDSLEHDIAGAQSAGWDSLFLTGGLYQNRFETGDWRDSLAQIATETSAPHPTYLMDELQ